MLPTKRHKGSFQDLFELWLIDETLLRKRIDKGYCFGWTNECFYSGLKRRVGWVVFIDYDDVPRSFVEYDCKRLQDKYDLGDAILLKTSSGYHVYFLDVVNRFDLKKICEDAMGDKLFVEVGLVKSKNILTFRLGQRRHDDFIKFSKVVRRGRRTTRPMSITHYNVLKAKWPQIKINLNRTKKTCNISFVCYKLNN